MAIESYDLITVGSDYRTVDNIVWRAYRGIARGMFEKTLDANPHLAKMHKHSPFLPVGAQLRIPIDPDVMANKPEPTKQVRWWETVRGKVEDVFLAGQKVP
jgi:phage tail protein X